MAWIESHQEVAHHPKTRKLARKLDIPLAQAVGHLHALWWWALDHAFDGDLTCWDSEDIALGALWEGDPEAFIKGLLEARGQSGHGFIEQDEERLIIHDWLSYTAHLRARKESAQKANHVRWHVERNAPDPSCEWCRTPNGVSAESTLPNLTRPEPDLTKPKERARRKSIEEEWKPTQPLIEWAATEYPHVDLVTETEKFIDHFRANGKPMKNWEAAWKNWIRRSRDFGSAVTT